MTVVIREVVADGMETILKDGKVVEFMADVKQKDHAAWEKIKGWFKNLAKFLQKMVDAYKGQSAQTIEGARVAEFSEDLLNQIKQIWGEGAVAAGENYQTAEVKEITTKAKNTSKAVDAPANLILAAQPITNHSDRQSGKIPLAGQEIVKYSDTRRFFPGNVFPSGKTHTDAFEWANRKDIQTGDNRLVFYRGSYYRIEKFDDMDFGYLITKKYDAQDYMEEETQYGEIDSEESVQSGLNEIVARSGETTEYGQGGYYADPPGSRYGSKNNRFRQVDADKDGWRKSSGQTERDRPGSLQDQRQTGQESLEWTPQELYDKMLDLDRKLVHASGRYATKLKNQRERYARMIGEMNGWDHVRLSDRTDDSISNRTLLANALEGVAQNDMERNRIAEYKEKIGQLDAQEKKLRELNAQIKEGVGAHGVRRGCGNDGAIQWICRIVDRNDRKGRFACGLGGCVLHFW